CIGQLRQRGENQNLSGRVKPDKFADQLDPLSSAQAEIDNGEIRPQARDAFASRLDVGSFATHREATSALQRPGEVKSHHRMIVAQKDGRLHAEESNSWTWGGQYGKCEWKV